MADKAHAQRMEAMLILEDDRFENEAPTNSVVEVREVAELSDNDDVRRPHLVRVPGAMHALELHVHTLGCCCLGCRGLPPPPPSAKGRPPLLLTLLVQLCRGLSSSSSIDVRTTLATKASRGAVGGWSGHRDCVSG
jgi:hypothetical protein